MISIEYAAYCFFHWTQTAFWTVAVDPATAFCIRTVMRVFFADCRIVVEYVVAGIGETLVQETTAPRSLLAAD